MSNRIWDRSFWPIKLDELGLDILGPLQVTALNSIYWWGETKCINPEQRIPIPSMKMLTVSVLRKILFRFQRYLGHFYICKCMYRTWVGPYSSYFKDSAVRPFLKWREKKKKRKRVAYFFSFRYMIAWLVVCTALSASVLAVQDGATTAATLAIYDPLPILHLQTKEEST